MSANQFAGKPIAHCATLVPMKPSILLLAGALVAAFPAFIDRAQAEPAGVTVKPYVLVTNPPPVRKARARIHRPRTAASLRSAS